MKKQNLGLGIVRPNIPEKVDPMEKVREENRRAALARQIEMVGRAASADSVEPSDYSGQVENMTGHVDDEPSPYLSD